MSHDHMDEPIGRSHLVAEAPSRLAWNPNDAYLSARTGIEAYLSIIPDPWLRGQTVHQLNNQSFGSSLTASALMRKVSDYIWSFNNLYSFFGLSSVEQQIPLQKTFNHTLCTHNADGSLNTIVSDDLAKLFPQGRENEWPHLVLTSNHARAWTHTDISELMQGFELTLRAAGLPKDKLCIFTNEMPVAEVQGKTIIVSAIHSEKDPFLNGAELIDRRRVLEDSQPQTAADLQHRSREHISPAAMRLAKLMFKLMCEPESHPMIRLNCSKIDTTPALKASPFIANYVGLLQKESTGISANDEHPITLRSDAAKVAAHISAIGFSKGANTVTDALRFLYQELKQAQKMTNIRERSGACHELTDADIKSLIGTIQLLSIAPGEVELTNAEINIAGIRRTTIINKNDVVAGQYTHYGSRQGDEVTIIDGTHEHSGHSPLDALGSSNAPGFIMVPANAEGAGVRVQAFRKAQQIVKDFVKPMLGRWQGHVAASMKPPPDVAISA